MTNFERLKVMSIEEFAKTRVYYDEALSDSFEYPCYVTMDIDQVYMSENDAIQAEIEWLNKTEKIIKDGSV